MSTEAGTFAPQKSIYLSFFLPEVLGVLPHPWSIIDNFVHLPPLPFWISRLLEIPLAYKNQLSSDEPELISQRRGIQRCPIGYRALLWRVSILGCWRMNLEREWENHHLQLHLVVDMKNVRVFTEWKSETITTFTTTVIDIYTLPIKTIITWSSSFLMTFENSTAADAKSTNHQSKALPQQFSKKSCFWPLALDVIH